MFSKFRVNFQTSFSTDRQSSINTSTLNIKPYPLNPDSDR